MKIGSKSNLEIAGSLEINKQFHAKTVLKHHYQVECYDKSGKRKWTEEFDNLVVTAGLNKYLDATLKTGLSSPAWYVGLKDTGTVVPGDTMASHGDWAELDVYTGNRKGFTPGTISGGSVNNSGSKAIFTIDTQDTVYGAFLCNAATGSGVEVTLLGAGDFSTPRVVEIDDTLNITITASIAAN